MMNVELSGLAEFEAAINVLPVQAGKLAAQVLNDEGRELKRQAGAEFSAATGVPLAFFRDRIAVRLAEASQLEARVVASSAGLPARAFRHSFELAGHPTRARIVVAWLKGQKLAAGFINPRGAQKAPLRTRGKHAAPDQPKDALAPSAAALFKDWRSEELLERTRRSLAERFQLAMAKSLESR